MTRHKKRGFVILVVLAFISVLILVAWIVVDIGCGEILQTNVTNESLSAYYAAISGAEMMYGKLKTMSKGQLPQTLTGTLMTRSVGGQTVGTFTVNASVTATNMLAIVSEGNVRGHRATTTVKYKFYPDYLNGSPIGSLGPVSMYGQNWWIFKSYVRSNTGITTGSTFTKNDYVQITGSVSQNQPIETPSFWWKYNASADTWSKKDTYDTFGTGVYINDVNKDGRVTIDDAMGDDAKKAIFRTNDINGDGEVNDKDAFEAYYTVELNQQNLGLAKGQSGHYEGNKVFGPGDVPTGRHIIFVNGNVTILYNDQNWSKGKCDHTVVSTGNITIVQPANGQDDRLTLVSYGDVNTGGINFFGDVKGNIDIYANGSFNAYYGGTSNGTILSKDSVYVDTVLPIPAFLNRNFNKGTDNWWNDPSNMPLGLPQRYNTIAPTSTMIDAAQEPIWERK